MLYFPLQTTHMDYQVAIPDIQKAITNQLNSYDTPSGSSFPYVTGDNTASQGKADPNQEEPQFNFARYHTLDEVLYPLNRKSRICAFVKIPKY